MKILFLFSVLNLCIGCTLNDSKFIRKQISNNDITIKCYYYSYITDTSPDLVVVERKNETKEIYKAERVVINVELKGDAIILRLVGPAKGLAYTKKVDNEVFGYKVLLDTTGTYEELNNRPDGIKKR